MMYRVEDDMGVLCEGSKADCIQAVRNWLRSDEAKVCYNKEEIEVGLDYFSREEAVSLMGFHISRI